MLFKKITLTVKDYYII